MKPFDLFSPLDLRGVRLRNRVGVSPMCMYSCEARDGMAGDWHLMHLGARAAGGAALVFTEAAAVEPRGRIAAEDLGIWDDRHVEPLLRVTRFVARYGAVPGIQLAHAGRKGGVYRPWAAAGRGSATPEDGGWQTVAPSPLAFSDRHAPPAELDLAGIAEIVASFRAATSRALDAGFRAVEIHAAHGYLLHQFLSPLSNRRRDAYGGSLANRMRLPLEVVDAVRAAWPEELPLFVRVSTTDWASESDGPAWDADQTVELARELREHGVDVVDCSSGGTLANARVPQGPGYQVANCARVRREAGVATAAVGLITEPAQADTIVRSGQADLVLLARAVLRDPNWPIHAARALGAGQGGGQGRGQGGRTDGGEGRGGGQGGGTGGGEGRGRGADGGEGRGALWPPQYDRGWA